MICSTRVQSGLAPVALVRGTGTLLQHTVHCIYMCILHYMAKRLT